MLSTFLFYLLKYTRMEIQLDWLENEMPINKNEFNIMRKLLKQYTVEVCKLRQKNRVLEERIHILLEIIKIETQIINSTNHKVFDLRYNDGFNKLCRKI